MSANFSFLLLKKLGELKNNKNNLFVKTFSKHLILKSHCLSGAFILNPLPTKTEKRVMDTVSRQMGGWQVGSGGAVGRGFGAAASQRTCVSISQHVDVAALLIKYNACVNATDKWAFTPLHEAAQKGRTQLCALLLAHGADPTLRNQEGQSPLDLVTVSVSSRCSRPSRRPHTPTSQKTSRFPPIF